MRGITIGAMRDVTSTVVADVNWSVAAGEFWVVAGPQHSGKSDFLMLTAGLMSPLAGSYKLFGRETQHFGEAELAQRLRVGFVFEGGQLFNELTIAENVALPLRYHQNHPPDAMAAAVKSLLDLMELTSVASVTPANVAANWRQRAALARALALKPEILLLDNPLAGLTARHLQWWLRFLDRLWRGDEFCGGRPMTIVVTSDDLRPWENARRKFALLHNGSFVQFGSWNDVKVTGNPVVKELLAVPVEATL